MGALDRRVAEQGDIGHLVAAEQGGRLRQDIGPPLARPAQHRQPDLLARLLDQPDQRSDRKTDER